MKKVIILLRTISVLTLVFLSISIFAQPMETAVKDITYTFSQSGGTNACAVAWNPVRKVYITVIAGNETFPLEGFNETGNKVFETQAGYDARGLWYNPSSKKFEGNGAGESGWVAFGIDPSGKPDKPEVFVKGQNQPDFQSVGAYDYQKKQIVFFNNEAGELKFYPRNKPSKVGSLKLDFAGVNNENINTTTVGFTGKKNYEFVLLDYYNGKLYFFNRKGKLTATTKLPSDAPLNYSFAFSFANDRVFLYDKEFRVWRAYKVFVSK